MRQLLITEEFGMYRVRTSEGVSVTGGHLPGALEAATQASGRAALFPHDENARRAKETADLFEHLVPPRARHDGPVST
jgi:hypothetical protein